MAPSSVQSSLQSGLSSSPEIADDPELGEDSSIQRSLLGVLYTVNKEKSSSSIPWIAFRLLSDWLQIWLLMVNPLYGFNINTKDTTWQIFSFIQLNAFMSARGYTFFVITLYIFVVMLAGSFAISFWIGWSFSNNRFNSLWPIVFLRSFSNFFFQALDIASMTLFLQALDCQYWNAPPGQQFHNQEFHGIECFTMPHLIHAGVAAVSLAVFIFMATLFTAGEMELNPVSRDVMAIPHSKVEVYGFLIKVLMTFASTFVSSLRWLSIVQLSLALIQLYLYVKWVPMLLDWVNHVRCASYASVTYAALIFVLIVYELGIDPDDPHAVKQHQVRLTNALYGGAVPAFLLGGAASWWRLRYFHKTVLTRIREAPSDSRPRSLYKFTDGRQVEVLLRSCRIWVDEDVLQTEAVSGAEAVLACAMAQLPKDPYVIILYSSFLIEVQSSYQTGYAQLQAAKKAGPDFLMLFAIFSREQAHTQRSASTGASGPVDLVGYVELQRNYQLALKVHRDALLATRAFWTCLLHWNVSLRTIAKAIKRIDITVKAAERVYKAVMRRHVNNAQMLRMYATFLETVKHDPWGASKWLAEADKLEEQEEHARNDDVFKLGDKSLQAVLGPAGSQEARAVVVIDAQGIVQMVNQTTLEMFGYGKMELKGKNVSMLVPPPFCEHHTIYIRNYITTGTEVILNSTSQLIAMHKDRYVMPIALTVTKISGIGEDTMFLGVMKATAVEADTATIWATASGQVVSVDMNFQDWTGFKPEDVAGHGVLSLVQESDALEKLLARFRASTSFSTKYSSAGVPAAAVVSSSGYVNASSHILDTQSTIPRKKTGIVLDGPSLQTDSTNTTRLGATLTTSLSGMAPSQPSPRASPGIQKAGTFNYASDQEMESYMQGADLEPRKTAFFHKYCDPVEMEVEVTTAGMGAFQLHVLTLRRMPPPEGKSHHVVVSDSRGRVIHATNSLAALLGTTCKQLQANNSTRAVEKIMAAPFAQLHRTLATSIPATDPPPYSCRSGLSILLSGSGPQGPFLVPFQISALVKRTTQEEAYHIMELNQRTTAEAVAERCLELTCNMQGIVCTASNSPEDLFGFVPADLVGHPLTAFIDIFKATLPNPLASEDLLVGLTRRAMRAPGTSINVAVAVPAGPALQGPDARVMARLVEDANTPAVMVVSVEGQLKAGSRKPIANKAPMFLKLQLWRSDLLTGVVQLDMEGKIMPTRSPMPMYPAGPILGVSAPTLIGTHIGRYLPLTSKSHMDLLKPGAVRNMEEMGLQRKRSSMKFDRPIRDEAQDSTMHTMRVMHMVDGQEMRLSVTAIRKVPSAAAAIGDSSSVGSMYLLFRIAGSPPGGRMSGLLECLAAPAPGLQSDLTASMGKIKRSISSAGPNKSSIHGEQSASMHQHLGIPGVDLQPLPGTPVAHNSQAEAPKWPDVDVLLPDPRAQTRAQPTLEEEASALMEHSDSIDRGSATPAPPTAVSLAATPSASLNAKAVRFGSDGAGTVAPSPAPVEVSRISLEMPQDRIALWVATANTGHSLKDVLEEHGTAGTTKGEAQDDVHLSDTSGNAAHDDDNEGHDSLSEEDEEEAVRVDLSDTEEPPDDAQATTTDYKKGSRSKRIMRLLSTDAVQASKARFKLHTRLVLLLLAVANIGGFVLMNQLLVAQSANVEALNTAGLAARFANRITTNTRILQILFTKQGIPGQNRTSGGAHIMALPGLSGDSDIPATLVQTKGFITGFQNAHEKSYSYATGSRASAELRSIWRDPVLIETAVYQTPTTEELQVPKNSTNGTIAVSLGAAREDYVIVPSNMTLQTILTPRNQSLFKLGNLLVGKAAFVVQNAYVYNESLTGPANSTDWGSMATAQWITQNAPNIITTTYFRVLDLMLLDVINAADTVNKIQMVLLAVEGVGLAALAIGYIVYLTIKVGNIRRHVFTIFLSLPTSMVRTLANEPINLPDQDDPSGTLAMEVPILSVIAAAAPDTSAKALPGAAGKGAAVTAQMTFGAVDDALKADEERPHSIAGRMLSVLRLWRPRKVQPKEKEHKSRRMALTNSLLTVVWMVFPILLWGALVVLMNVLGHGHLAQIGSPISTFNIINFVAVRYQRNLALMTGLAANPDPSLDAGISAAYEASTAKLAIEVNAMLYGGATANDPRPHFMLTKTGISDQPMAADLLYHAQGCVCTDPAELTLCAQPDDPNYAYLSRGLEVSISKLVEIAESLSYTPTLAPKLWGPEFGYYWTGRSNIRCALNSLNLLYQDNVTQSYKSVLTLHIVLFIIAWIIFAAYLLFILRPFVAETTAETRRVADLLSELPPEMDVEGLIQRMVIAKYVPPAVVEEVNKAVLLPAQLKALSQA